MDPKKLKDELMDGANSAMTALIQGSEEGPLKDSIVITTKNLAAFVSSLIGNAVVSLAPRTVDDTGCIGDEELADAFEMAARELRKSARNRECSRLLGLRAQAEKHLDAIAEEAAKLVRQTQNATTPLKDLYEAFQKLYRQTIEVPIGDMAVNRQVVAVRDQLIGQLAGTMLDIQDMIRVRSNLS